jgi:hypothetical protein
MAINRDDFQELLPAIVMAQNEAVNKINWMTWDQAISLQKVDRENYNKDKGRVKEIIAFVKRLSSFKHFTTL